jgi:flagellar hook-length control protein FliK
MNATPPVLQAPPLSDPVQSNAPASAASATPRTGSQDFAAAFRDAGGKPARKSTANKQQDPASSGSSLPAPGNQPPPVVQAPPPPAKTDVSAAAVAPAVVADAATSAKGVAGSAPGPAPSAMAAASAAEANASGTTTILSATNLDPTLLPAAAAFPGIASAVPAAGDDAASPPAAAGPTLPGAAPGMPHAASIRTLATPGISTAAPVPAVPGDNTLSAKLRDAGAKPGTTSSANSAPTPSNALNDSTASNGPAATGTDAAAQALMAAAIAQGKNPPSSDTDSSVPQGAAMLSDAAAGAAAAAAPAVALAQASAAAISAAMTAATAAATAAASIAQAVFADVSPSAADKRSHGNSPDSTVAGASSDGSVGAAQLLTSNTSTDGVPTPTFKVAAAVDTAQFGQGVADRVALMMDGNLTSAKLQVNPPALGPIEVRIALQGGHAQVSFLSHSAVTRDALEASSSKLREMLGSQGFSQVSVDISQRSFQERSPQSQAYEAAPSIGDDVPAVAQASLSMSRSASALLDAYA